jgi:hypothetical protein
MGKFSYRITRALLLCAWVCLLFADNRGSEYRSIRIQSSDANKVVFFLISVIITKVGNDLDKRYVCPGYCAVDHIHRHLDSQSSFILKSPPRAKLLKTMHLGLKKNY